ncbi:DUF483 domain-containing protein [Candidatus Woesearchaeota archaeon]|nr:DUF483 domain-containing protein [Candidatus Woesearchaeota archaeon]
MNELQAKIMNVRELSLIFGSKSKAHEILYLLKDVKKVVRQGFYEPELAKVEEFCQQHNLTLAKSRFKVLLADETAFSNKGIKISGDDLRPGLFFVYISKNEREAWLASYYELTNDSEELGRLLGYPNCCIDFFIKRFTPDNPNLQLKPTNPYTNLAKRDKDQVLISHFPCSSNCPESIKMGKTFFNALFEFDQEYARELFLSLSD